MKRQELGLRGRAYVQEMLAAGATLSRLVQEANAPGSGTVWTFVPADFVLNRRISFTSSLAWGHAAGWPEEYWLHHFSELLTDPMAWLVIEDRFMGAPDHAVEVPDYFFAGSEVYYCINGDPSIETIEVSLRHRSRWPSLCFLGSGGVLADGTHQRQRTREDLEMIASHTRAVVVGAFDEDSYLLWDFGETA